MKNAVIEVDALRKTYYDGLLRRRSVPALQEVSLSVEKGSIFGLLGPNGAGKTTLIKILLGLVFKSGGKASLLGHPAGDRSGRSRVGYLPEHHRIPRHLNGNSALAYYGGLSGLSPSDVRLRRGDLLTRVGLSEWGTMPVKKYSKGMLQRLGLAQAMLHEPDLLILDEPTDGVDPVGRREMRTLLQRLKQEGKTIFINSHLLQEVELVCDRVAILVEGTLRAMGTIEEITKRQQPDVEFVVAGDEQPIHEALGQTPIVALTPAPLSPPTEGIATVFQVRITAENQATVNQCIDQLRGRSIDILSITPLRDTLEDAFLNIVSQ